MHWARAEGVRLETTASKAATDLYAKFGYAAESYLLSTFPDATSQHFGRASRITFKKVKASLANENGHIYMQPCVSFWEHLGTRLRLFKGLLKNGSDSTPVFQETCEAIQRMQNAVHKNWPAGQKLFLQRLLKNFRHCFPAPPSQAQPNLCMLQTAPLPEP